MWRKQLCSLSATRAWGELMWMPVTANKMDFCKVCSLFPFNNWIKGRVDAAAWRSENKKSTTCLTGQCKQIPKWPHRRIPKTNWLPLRIYPESQPPIYQLPHVKRTVRVAFMRKPSWTNRNQASLTNTQDPVSMQGRILTRCDGSHTHVSRDRHSHQLGKISRMEMKSRAQTPVMRNLGKACGVYEPERERESWWKEHTRKKDKVGASVSKPEKSKGPKLLGLWLVPASISVGEENTIGNCEGWWALWHSAVLEYVPMKRRNLELIKESTSVEFISSQYVWLC